jgi:hypothetical protein
MQGQPRGPAYQGCKQRLLSTQASHREERVDWEKTNLEVLGGWLLKKSILVIAMQPKKRAFDATWPM